MDAKKLAAWGAVSTLVTSHIPSNITYTMLETTKEINRQYVRKEDNFLEIPTNIDNHSFVLQTEKRITRVETKIDSVEGKIEDLSRNFTYLSNDVKNLSLELRTYLDNKFIYLESKFERLESKIDVLEDKTSAVESTINKTKWFVAGVTTVIGLLASVITSFVSYMGLDKLAKAIKAITLIIHSH